MVRFAAAAGIFFPRLRLCVFFHGVPTKKGLRWCLFLIYQATTTLDRHVVCSCLSTQPRFLQPTLEISQEILRFYAFPPVCVAGLQQMPPQRIPHYYPKHRRDPLPETFLTDVSTHLPLLRFAFIQICSIDPKTKCA